MPEKKLKEIAAEISVHLKRFEADKELNKSPYRDGVRFFCPFSVASGRFVYVTYRSYQGDTPLPKQVALEYLEWLNSGRVGTHFQMQAEKEKAKKP